MDLVWQEPVGGPPRTKRDWSSFVTALQERPGEWAIALQRPTNGSLTQQAERLKDRGCEATVRKQEDGTHILYARWKVES